MQVPTYNLDMKSLRDRNLVYVAGYVARKWRYNFGRNRKECCISTCCISRETTQYNAILIDKKNRGRLMYPSSLVVKLAGQCMDVIHSISLNENYLQTFKEATTDRIVAMKIGRQISQDIL